LLQDALLGSFESAHMDSTTRVVLPVVLEHMNAAIAKRGAEITVEFAEKEVADKRLMAAK
jgi:hypothetical protein